MYDLLLKGGGVYDGSGLPSYNAAVGVVNGKIAGIGRLKRRLGRNLLVRKCRNVGSLAGVLDGDSADIAVAVEVKDRVLIEIFGFSDFDSAKLNV